MQEPDGVQTSKTGKLVILVHGYGSNRHSWDLVIDRFPDGLNAQAIDLVGCGSAAPDPNFKFTFEEQAQALANRLSDVQQPYTIVAHSMGAAIALIAVLDYHLAPDRIILVDPLLFNQRTPFFINIQTIPVLSWLGSYLVPPPVQVDLVIRRVYKRFKSVNSGLRQIYIDAFQRTHHRRVLRETAIVIRSFNGTQYVDRFNEIDMPVDLIWSREDPLLSFEFAADFADQRPKTRVFPIDDCGHAPQEECPDSFLVEISKIFATIKVDGK